MTSTDGLFLASGCKLLDFLASDAGVGVTDAARILTRGGVFLVEAKARTFMKRSLPRRGLKKISP